jgi:sulfonate transport system permease protein
LETRIEGAKVLLIHTAITVGRIVIGTIGGLFAVLVATYVYWAVPNARSLLAGFSQISRGIPLLAIIPLFVFWFGGSPLGIYTYIAFGVYVVSLPTALAGVDLMSPQWVEAARIYRLSSASLFLRVVVPGAFPFVSVGLRSSIGLCWAFSLGGEYLVARDGLGYLASLSYIHADMGKLICLLVIYGSLGLASNKLLAAIVNAKQSNTRKLRT